jgi:hypothetical protein
VNIIDVYGRRSPLSRSSPCSLLRARGIPHPKSPSDHRIPRVPAQRGRPPYWLNCETTRASSKDDRILESRDGPGRMLARTGRRFGCALHWAFVTRPFNCTRGAPHTTQPWPSSIPIPGHYWWRVMRDASTALSGRETRRLVSAKADVTWRENTDPRGRGLRSARRTPAGRTPPGEDHDAEADEA